MACFEHPPDSNVLISGVVKTLTKLRDIFLVVFGTKPERMHSQAACRELSTSCLPRRQTETGRMAKIEPEMQEVKEGGAGEADRREMERECCRGLQGGAGNGRYPRRSSAGKRPRILQQSGFAHYSAAESHNDPESNLDQSNSFWTLHWRCKNL